jgi:hypothetical protein
MSTSTSNNKGFNYYQEVVEVLIALAVLGIIIRAILHMIPW